MISATGNLNPYAFSFSSGAAGKLYVPVKPASVIYAQYDHVSGFAAKRGENGVSLSKVQILNTLIGHLSAMKGNSAPKVDTLSEEQIDAMIKNLQSQAKVSMLRIAPAAAAPSAQYALSGAKPQAGILFNIEA